MPDAVLCRAVYREMYRAMIAKDIPALSAVLDDGFILVHMTGLRQSKAAFLQAVADVIVSVDRANASFLSFL